MILFVTMTLHVDFPMVKAEKALAAKIAKEIPDAGVGFQMVFQIIVGVETLSAFVL